MSKKFYKLYTEIVNGEFAATCHELYNVSWNNKTFL